MFVFFLSDRSVLDPASYGLSGGEVFSVEGVLDMPNGQTEATLEEIQSVGKQYTCTRPVHASQRSSCGCRPWRQQNITQHMAASCSCSPHLLIDVSSFRQHLESTYCSSIGVETQHVAVSAL